MDGASMLQSLAPLYPPLKRGGMDDQVALDYYDISKPQP
jgi:hypothetical protein